MKHVTNLFCYIVVTVPLLDGILRLLAGSLLPRYEEIECAVEYQTILPYNNLTVMVKGLGSNGR
jgi:hypothetical protein